MYSKCLKCALTSFHLIIFITGIYKTPNISFDFMYYRDSYNTNILQSVLNNQQSVPALKEFTILDVMFSCKIPLKEVNLHLHRKE